MLTNRERDVVDLLTVFGLSNRHIGIALSLRTDTVRYYLQHVMDKLDLHTRLDVAKWRLSRGNHART